MKKLVLCLLITFLFVAPLGSPTKAIAAPYYEGKILTLVVGYGPGGTYDPTARLLAKHLPKYIPGKPTVIVQNMPGAGSMIATNFIYSQAKPDGLTIGTFSRSHAFAQLIEFPGVKFDLRRFSWIGSPCAHPIVLVIRSSLPYKAFEDLLKAKEAINLGRTGVSSVDSYFPTILQDYLGLKVKLITYKDSASIALAIEQKECDGWAGALPDARRLIDRGAVIPVLRGKVLGPGLEKVPANTDFTNDEKAKRLMSLISIPDKAGQPYAAPPGTPSDFVNILREAFGKWAKDPQVREEAEKIMITPEYASGDELLKIYNEILQQPPEMVQELKKYIKF